MIEVYFVGTILIVGSVISGFVFAKLLGMGIEQNRWQRLPVGLIWIGIAGIIGWVWSQNVFMTNLLTGLAIIGFLARCAFEALNNHLARLEREGLY
ncbi:MAG: hypothetical protein Q8S35_03275 [bacterium]|nr:hypothetical protein [bacterium]